MGRRGMVTIGVAVQAETFSNSNNPSPVPNLESTTPTPTPVASSSKSAIYLPPSKDGSPQTLRITFNYNKETNLPEIIVNLDGEENEGKYLELKELCRGNVTALLEEQQETSSNQEPSSSEKGKDVQVYYFNEINMNSSEEKKVDSNNETQEIPAKVSNPSTTESERKPQAEESNDTTTTTRQEDVGGEEEKTTSCNKNNKNDESENVSKLDPSLPESPKMKEDVGHIDANKRQGKKQKKSILKATPSPESRGTSMSPDRRRGVVTSPTKDNDKSKIPIIHSSATGFMPCEYYRQKLLQDIGCTDFTNPRWIPNYYTSIQKTAGQKVVEKLAAQQKQLEEQAAAHRRRTEFIYHEDLGFCEVPEKFPLVKKKQTRLEPLRIPRCY